MNNDTLPAELLDEVFTLLTPPLDDSAAHDLDEPISKSDLVACALTCRSWCIRARPYLFHSLVFSFRNTDEGDEDRRRVPIGAQTFTNVPFEALQKFLATNPHLANGIRSLDLRCYPREIELLAHLHSPAPSCVYLYRDSDAIPLSALLDTIELLPRLRFLNLADVILKPDASGTSVADLPTLERLAIQRFYRNTLSFPLDDLLAHLNPIPNLALTNIDLPASASGPDAPPLRVESLTVRGGGAPHILPPRLDAFMLRSLDLGNVHPQHDRWLCALAPSLATFGCTLTAGVGPFGPWPYVHDLPRTVAPLFAVRTLVLRVADGAMDGWPAHVLALERAVVLIDSLATCVPDEESSHPFLTNIHFMFDAAVDLSKYRKPCREIEEAVLRLLTRSNLQKVDIAMSGAEVHRRNVRDAFPKLEEMGILSMRRLSTRPVEMSRRLRW